MVIIIAPINIIGPPKRVQKPNVNLSVNIQPINPPITGSNNKITETTIGGNHFRTVFIPVWPARPGPKES